MISMRRKKEFLEVIQIRAARIAVSASATRGQRAPGLVAAARGYLGTLPLDQFAVARPQLFKERLNHATSELIRVFPKDGRSWGMARKLLNIFLRDAFYTAYLKDAYRLEVAEHNYELPLDSITARHLRADAAKGHLPRWRGVKYLTPQASEILQATAATIASSRGIARIHLDAYWWGGSR